MVSWLRTNGKIIFRGAALLLAGAAAGFGLGLFFAVPAGPGCQESDLTPVPDTGFASPAPEAAPASSLPQEEPVPEKWVCLTFDDGPSKTTPAVLDALNTAGVKATFLWWPQATMKNTCRSLQMQRQQATRSRCIPLPMNTVTSTRVPLPTGRISSC